MPCVWASLAVAASKLKEIKTDNVTVHSLLLELETATNLAEAFDKTWHSIFWNKASKKTRVRVTITLEKLAKSIFDHLEESLNLFNQLCDEQEQLPTLELTKDWLNIRGSIALAKSGFQETHANFIKPLPLFQYLEKMNS
jgi:hypothetical protein